MTSQSQGAGSMSVHPGVEQLLTFKEVAGALGVHYWQIQRAVSRGDIPSYAPFNKRRFVRLSEVVAFIDASRQGGYGD